MMIISRNNHQRGIAGFTLAEVSLAVGIAAFGMIAILGVMPLAFETLEEANSSGIEARIGSQLLDELRSVNFNELTSYDGDKREFDADGVEITRDSRGLVHFVALIEVEETAQRIPGGEERETAPTLRRVAIKLTSTPGSETRSSFDFDDPENASRYKVFEGSIARLGVEE